MDVRVGEIWNTGDGGVEEVYGNIGKKFGETIMKKIKFGIMNFILFF